MFKCLAACTGKNIVVAQGTRVVEERVGEFQIRARDSGWHCIWGPALPTGAGDGISTANTSGVAVLVPTLAMITSAPRRRHDNLSWPCSVGNSSTGESRVASFVSASIWSPALASPARTFRFFRLPNGWRPGTRSATTGCLVAIETHTLQFSASGNGSSRLQG